MGVARASSVHHATRHDCPTSNDMCNGCGKHRHWQQVCRASSVKFVSDGDQNLNSNPQSTYVITHVICQDSLKGIFFDLDLSPPASTPASPRRLRLTLVTPATLYMSLTSTSSPLYEWICPLSVSLTTQVSHPNLGANHITVHLAWEIIQDYCPINQLIMPPSKDWLTASAWGHYPLWCGHC